MPPPPPILSLVIPCYNEAENLRALFAAIIQAVSAALIWAETCAAGCAGDCANAAPPANAVSTLNTAMVRATIARTVMARLGTFIGLPPRILFERQSASASVSPVRMRTA